MHITVSLMIYHCNGIICVNDNRVRAMYLINLTIKEYCRLPLPLISNKFLMHRMGLGHNSMIDDFNVVRIGSGANLSTVAKLYSLRTDSCRVITTTISVSYFS